jgi:hypothetical protein
LSSDNIATWRAENVVDYLGQTEDVRPFLRACTTFVLPTYYREGLPRTVIEALAIGRPVITTDISHAEKRPSTASTASSYRSAILAALAVAMRRFVDDPSLSPRMGKASRQIAEEIFDVEKVNAVMIRPFDMKAPGSVKGNYRDAVRASSPSGPATAKMWTGDQRLRATRRSGEHVRNRAQHCPRAPPRQPRTGLKSPMLPGQGQPDAASW